ncbi:hypothetical protein QWJ41_14110 [Nocardioides sp. SOB44]|uniref:Uncharacterized protein n=1 Tax=Nocardioides cremeus TaxID=3058044 RepID=A0ABT8TSD2_9ACTN|nr:hypothetical protein [Nocardioides cremeus]MDO3396860.1 hypothetical protein [Nocardioides cremeus]
MTRYTGRRIVSLFPGLDQTLQDALLAAIEHVLIEAEAERIWIEESPTHDLRVHAQLPPVDAAPAPVVPIGAAPSALTIRSSVSVDPSTADKLSPRDCPDTESVE